MNTTSGFRRQPGSGTRFILLLSSFSAVLALVFAGGGVTSTQAQSIYAQRIRVGSATAFTDSGGHVWTADQPYSPGGYGYTEGAYIYSTTATIANTLDVPVFQSNRHDSAMAYRFDVPNGTYQIRLRFAEIYPNSFAVGRRVFNVSIGGAAVLQNLDVFAVAGANTALDETFQSTVTSGALTITFSGVVSMPEVNAIEVLASSSGGSTPTATSTATPPATATPPHRQPPARDGHRHPNGKPHIDFHAAAYLYRHTKRLSHRVVHGHPSTARVIANTSLNDPGIADARQHPGAGWNNRRTYPRRERR